MLNLTRSGGGRFVLRKWFQKRLTTSHKSLARRTRALTSLAALALLVDKGNKLGNTAIVAQSTSSPPKKSPASSCAEGYLVLSVFTIPSMMKNILSIGSFSLIILVFAAYFTVLECFQIAFNTCSSSESSFGTCVN